ncbi:hypothetical protein Q4591_10540 [Shewanella sp. 3_MG-2023]|uniref:hypothetical protein n=1 Tax=Shewanella sp. 3_MG-2023 TaxID=3062635 RepID=UPI0026E23ED2|nr:hypothetical protein [Shewanella sp. 3_MG-2023]MDO6775796.1 hypothetical protein [Shewanella sp. 3_MG-2023]
MSRSNITSVNPFKGFYHQWCKDVGSVSFLLTGLLGLCLAVVSVTVRPEKVESLYLLIGMSILSVCTAIAWQLIKLAANEAAVLTPYYRRLVYIQSTTLFSACLVVCSVILVWAQQPFVSSIWYILAIGLGLIYTCMKNPKCFNYCVVLFFSLPLLTELELLLPKQINSTSFLLPIILIALIIKQTRELTWSDDARSVYLNGLETGWLVLPKFSQSLPLVKLNQYFYPASYFIGPMLAALLIAIPVLGVIGLLAAAYFTLDAPMLMIVSQMLLVLCSLVHWTRVQRWRAAESLFVLPSFNGKQDLLNQFFKSQLRLLACITLLMSFLTMIAAMFNPQISIAVGVHLVVSVIWSSGIALALGAMSRSVWQVSLSMAMVAIQALWLSNSLVQLRDQGAINAIYYWGDIGLLVLMAALLVISKDKLWKNGVTKM